MQGCCMSLTSERESGVNAGKDLGGNYWGLLVYGEVKNLGHQMTQTEHEITPGWLRDVFET